MYAHTITSDRTTAIFFLGVRYCQEFHKRKIKKSTHLKINMAVRSLSYSIENDIR